MNLSTSDFEKKKIGFNPFEKSDERSEDNRNHYTRYYKQITLNNFEAAYSYKEKRRIAF